MGNFNYINSFGREAIFDGSRQKEKGRIRRQAHLALQEKSCKRGYFN